MQNKFHELLQSLNDLLTNCDCWAASEDRTKVRELLSDLSKISLWEPIDTAPKTSEWLIVKDGPLVVTAYWEHLDGINAWVMLNTYEIIYPTQWLNLSTLGE